MQNNTSLDSGSDDQSDYEDGITKVAKNIQLYGSKLALRASTAPARPLTEIEEFRRASDFLLLEHTVICASQLIQRSDQKYDLDSPPGQRSCKKFLNQLERLCEVFKANTPSRDYRKEFSKAYRVLYKEGSLCYLTEILDSAQEGFPYLYVNGEKYVFSKEVLEAGNKLFNSFCKIQHVLRNIYNRTMEESAHASVNQIKHEICKALEEFDHNWVTFEHLYVLELMLIEADARRFISEAIESERDIVLLEVREKAKGRIVLDSQDYHQCRTKLVTLCCKLNAVANPEGKGRDDLPIDILVAAEGLTRRISSVESKAVRVLAEKIRQSFNNLRLLFRKYEQNIEIVDPQLKNNPELVEALMEFEGSWEKGKTYFMNSKKCSQLIHFSQLIEVTAEKHKDFFEQIECREADIFVTIPCLVILKALEDDDKNICRDFFPAMHDENFQAGQLYKSLKKMFMESRAQAKSEYDYYNIIEKAVIGLEWKLEIPKDHKIESYHVETILHKIRQLAMELHRCKPTDWNKFLDVAMGSM
mmetsp:Transcript_23094/g.26127  ORF Transcript_23094/g.26127 Transcript_23094/m.26127 type:complete len:530 (+) Transcript_23094:109-1698(+)|eukprot:CAMPEP_0114986938 /NCGR_PEP_ID=MMETSP0216-20121206/8706_1 /TAXON_ID=223996 /ORGANISM="Protocruzia adherens, Strain Boccale" /LENGTH=529 /DNA_ID=CAMNT_0002349433 /DNA_START=89 /DNA_END=1678 /DNA_ORIENTATION=-